MKKRGREMKKYIQRDGVRGGLSSAINLFHSASLLSVLKMRGGLTHFTADWKHTHAHWWAWWGTWSDILLTNTYPPPNPICWFGLEKTIKASLNPHHTRIHMRYSCSSTCFAIGLSALQQWLIFTLKSVAWKKLRGNSSTMKAKDTTENDLPQQQCLCKITHSA